MEEMIKKMLEEKIQSPEFQQQIEKAMNKALEDALHEVTGYCSQFQKNLKAKIEPLMNSVLNYTNFEDLVNFKNI